MWQKVKPGLSAGRVQSVANRLIVERERQRIEFQTASYSSLEAEMSSGVTFKAGLTAVNGVRVATGRDFDAQGQLSQADRTIVNTDQGKELAAALSGVEFTVQSVESKPYRRRPAAPFMTSTLQQEASGRWASLPHEPWVPHKSFTKGPHNICAPTVRPCRTDALSAARTLIRERFGHDHLPADARVYNKKVKNAQEAHEAIRPAGDAWKTHPTLASKEINR